MELGYNTDITIEAGTFHVQTEGRLDTNPRVDTLVYKSGAVLQRVSNPDPDLGKDDRRVEETKRKIRDQHLAVVGLVRRGEIEKVVHVKPSQGAYDFLDAAQVTPAWREVLLGRHEVLFDEWRRAMADAAGLITPNVRHSEFRTIIGSFARILEQDAADKQGLLSYVLRFDARFKVIDVYEAFRREKEEVPEFRALVDAVKKNADRLVDLLILQASRESALATELLIELFTRQSMELVKYLFEQAEKKLLEDTGHGSEGLPSVLLYLEEKVASENMGNKELDDIFDRLNYLYSRMSVKAVREVSARVARIRDHRGSKTQLRPEQKKKVEEYISFLDGCKEAIEQAWDLEKKLELVNEFKQVMDEWDKVLRLAIKPRLALKSYHNFVTVNILETAELVAMKLRKEATKLPGQRRVRGDEVFQSLRGSLDAKANVRTIIVPAIEAQALLKLIEAEGAMAAAEPADDATYEQSRETTSPEGGDEAPEDPGDLDPVIETEPVGEPSSLRDQGGPPVEAPPGAAAGRGAPPAAPGPSAARVKGVEERVKVAALGLLRAIEEMTHATREVDELLAEESLTEGERRRVTECRRELVLKKKVLQHRFTSL